MRRAGRLSPSGRLSPRVGRARCSTAESWAHFDAESRAMPRGLRLRSLRCGVSFRLPAPGSCPDFSPDSGLVSSRYARQAEELRDQNAPEIPKIAAESPEFRIIPAIREFVRRRLETARGSDGQTVGASIGDTDIDADRGSGRTRGNHCKLQTRLVGRQTPAIAAPATADSPLTFGMLDASKP
jgi:hypothetical protein